MGSFGGPITRNLTFFLSGALEGQKAVATGMDAQKSPIFVQAGIDTVVAVPERGRTIPTADTTMVPVYNYAAYRGECERLLRQRRPRTSPATTGSTARADARPTRPARPIS